MKRIIILLASISSLFMISCDKGDMEVKKLNRGEGIWVIESVQTDQYDSAGVSVISTLTVNDPGEFVFFQNTTLNGLFDEHLVVVNMNDTSGVITAFPGGVYYDDNRVKIDAGCPYDGVWTVVDNGRRKQEWSIFSTNVNGGLQSKMTMFIKKK